MSDNSPTAAMIALWREILEIEAETREARSRLTTRREPTISEVRAALARDASSRRPVTTADHERVANATRRT